MQRDGRSLSGPVTLQTLPNSSRRSGRPDHADRDISPGFRKTEGTERSTILEAAQKAGFYMNVVCGGQEMREMQRHGQSGEIDFD